MNFVIVKHPKCSQFYLFRCPENIQMSPFIDVNCETRYGTAEGITAAPSFEVPEERVDELCNLFGTRMADLRFVKSVVMKKEIDLSDSDSLRALANGRNTCDECGECEEDEEDLELDEEKTEAVSEFLEAVLAFLKKFDEDKK